MPLHKYLVVIEKAENNYSAFSPDLPGCITVGNTLEDTIHNIKDAIELYLEATVEHDQFLPDPKGLRYYLEEGIFNENAIAEEYFIGRIEVHFPKIAA